MLREATPTKATPTQTTLRQGDLNPVEHEVTKDKVDLRSVSRDFVYRHHVAPRGQQCNPQESSFPILLKSIDVIDRQNKFADTLEESSIDDCWNVDGKLNSVGRPDRIHTIPNSNRNVHQEVTRGVNGG